MTPKRRPVAHSQPPLTAEHLAKFENTAATVEMPARWAEFLSRRRLELTVTGRMKGEPFEALRSHDAAGIRRWNLAPGVAIGMRGRKLERLTPRRVRVRAGVERLPSYVVGASVVGERFGRAPRTSRRIVLRRVSAGRPAGLLSIGLSMAVHRKGLCLERY